MIETNNPEINVDQIMAKIKKEIANRSTEHGLRHNDDAFADEIMSEFDMHHLNLNIGIAEENSVIGRKEFSMLRFNRMIRGFAKLASRIVLYVTKIITFPQTNFNLSILNVIAIIRDGIVNMERRINHHENSINRLNDQIDTLQENLQDQRKSQEQLNTYFQSTIASQESRLVKFLELARKKIPEPLTHEKLEEFASEQQHLFDPLYLHFEDKFRGSSSEIKDRLQVYIPLIETCDAGTPEFPIIDIGCGRGEWIELISAQKRSIVGVDLNKTLVAQCAQKGMNVIEQDAITYLQSLPDNSVGAITAFHLIEHLPFNTLLFFLNESLRVLRKGGIVIFETPNPENIFVGTCNFYLDPTHRNPIPPQLIRFLLETRGFQKIEIMRLHPYPEESRITDDDSELVNRLNNYFYGPQDFAIIGYKS